MSIIKQIQERRKALLEISTKLADSYIRKAVDKDSNLKPERVAGATMIARKLNKMDGIPSKHPAKVALTREEVEQIDEISKFTTHRYLSVADGKPDSHRKAAASQREHGKIMGDHSFTKSADVHDKLANKREAGIKMAKKKLGNTKLKDIYKMRPGETDGDLPAATHNSAGKKLKTEEVELSPIMETIIDLLAEGQNILKKRGRPRKTRHEDGNIVNE